MDGFFFLEFLPLLVESFVYMDENLVPSVLGETIREKIKIVKYTW